MRTSVVKSPSHHRLQHVLCISGPRGPGIGIGPGSGASPAAMPVMPGNNPHGFQHLGMVPQANLSQQNMAPPMAPGQVAAGPGGLQGPGTSLMTLQAQNMHNPGQVPNLGPNKKNASSLQNLVTATPNTLNTPAGQAQPPWAGVDRNILGVDPSNTMQNVQQWAHQARRALWTGIVPRVFAAG